MSIKISVIGAGSSVFSLNLVRDICLTPNLHGSVVSLMDIDEQRLDSIHSLLARYSEETGAKLRLEKTTDRRKSIDGADFVINTALASSHDRWQECWDIARKHGYRFGGSYHVMHDEAFWINFYQLRLHESVLNDIQEVCPSAWYLLVANPVLAAVTYLENKYPRAKMVGICHGYYEIYRLAEVLGLDRNEITFELPGVNHFLWLTKFFYRGEDAFPYIDRWLEEKGERFWENIPWEYGLGAKAFDLYKRFGAFPVGDTCTPGGGSWPSWYHTDSEVERKWGEDPDQWWQKDYFGDLKQRVSEIAGIAGDSSTKVSEVFPPQASGETMIPLIESLALDIPRVFILNILNTGSYLPGIPQDFEVEVPTLASKHGLQGIRTDGLPAPLIAHIFRDRIAPVRTELGAFTAGSRELLTQLVLMDPWTRSEGQARSLIDEILALPYHEEMRAHYR